LLSKNTQCNSIGLDTLKKLNEFTVCGYFVEHWWFCAVLCGPSTPRAKVQPRRKHPNHECFRLGCPEYHAGKTVQWLLHALMIPSRGAGEAK
jgi:hypothetical protein